MLKFVEPVCLPETSLRGRLLRHCIGNTKINANAAPFWLRRRCFKATFRWSFHTARKRDLSFVRRTARDDLT